jgi:transcriptional regulator of aromatic amino acid metabolism
MTIALTSPNVLRVFEIAGLDVLYEIFPSRRKAIQRLGITPD